MFPVNKIKQSGNGARSGLSEAEPEQASPRHLHSPLPALLQAGNHEQRPGISLHINEFEDPRALRQGIARYIQFYNEERPHQSLGEARPIRRFSP